MKSTIRKRDKIEVINEATYVQAAAFKTFLTPLISSLSISPVARSILAAHLLALSSTGRVIKQNIVLKAYIPTPIPNSQFAAVT